MTIIIINNIHLIVMPVTVPVPAQHVQMCKFISRLQLSRSCQTRTKPKPSSATFATLAYWTKVFA